MLLGTKLIMAASEEVGSAHRGLFCVEFGDEVLPEGVVGGTAITSPVLCISDNQRVSRLAINKDVYQPRRECMGIA